MTFVSVFSLLLLLLQWAKKILPLLKMGCEHELATLAAAAFSESVEIIHKSIRA